MKVSHCCILFLALIFTNCGNSKKYSETKYDDQPLSISKRNAKHYTRTFTRHNLTYVDSISNKKIISRVVYDENRILYRFPMRKAEFGNPDIKLLSGRNFLIRGMDDTVQFVNLPLMNRTSYVKGAAISRVSDSSYLIRTVDPNSKRAVFFISLTFNYEEIKNRENVILDSLVMPVH